MAKKNQAKIKDQLLTTALKHVPFDGWSKLTMQLAAKDIGLDPDATHLYFMNGAIDMVDYFCSRYDGKMLAKIHKLDLSNMKIRDKIKEAILIRLELFAPIKNVIAKTVGFLSLPWNALYSTKFIWRTCDLIWYEAGGDQSTDFNYYTKRTLLAGVYVSTLMYWLSDNSKSFADTNRFLDDRIENVMQIGKLIGRQSKSKK